MKFTDKILDKIQENIKDYLDKNTLLQYEIFCVCYSEKKRIVLFVNSTSLSACAYFSEDIERFNKLINEASNLTWIYEDDYFVLKSGYIVFHDEIDNKVIEEYNIIENDEIHSPVLYINGKQEYCESMDPGCPCAFCSWEPDLDIFRFERSLPDGRNKK